jgi:hypothetical protein
VAQAKEELRDSMGGFVEQDKWRAPHHYQFHMPPSGKNEDITFDYLVDAGHYMVGDPDTVSQQIIDFYKDCGGFGVLMLLMGKDWATPGQRARSMTLFMEHVAPRLHDLDPDRDFADEIRAAK